MRTRITELFDIKYPIIQGGMVWVSGWRLASAVSENGGLGLIGAGSMKPELLREHIRKCKNATKHPFGVNLPLLRKDIENLIDVCISEKIRIVFTSAGHPGKYLEKFKSENINVVHVVSSLKHAIKAESCGVDAIVAEGVEAGGHNGLDEITTFCLIPQLRKKIKIPIIAAGGIVSGNGIAAALALGAEGVQIGTLFASSIESSASELYKQKIINATDSSTTLIFKTAGMARVIKNELSQKAVESENMGATREELLTLLGEKREMKGIFEGDEKEGMFEAGQGSGFIEQSLSIKEIMGELIHDYFLTIDNLPK